MLCLHAHSAWSGAARRQLHLLCRASASSSSPAVPGRRRRRTTRASSPQLVPPDAAAAVPGSSAAGGGVPGSSPSSSISSSGSSIGKPARKGRATRKGSEQEPPEAAPAAPAAAAAAAIGIQQHTPAATTSSRRSTKQGHSTSSNTHTRSNHSSSSLFAPAPDHPGLSAVRSWVVFSDLHVSSKSMQSALEVLRRVHEEAAARQAGILFLGDFWDRRGDLPVIPLNATQQEVASWQDTPLLLLPGNHDQVDLQGHHHALHPVAVAAQCAHVFTEPTLYRDSLWLPYRRDEGVIREAISTALQQGPLKAIFGHADVLTAHMNASYQARDGLPPELFPERIPVYLGHYHFPHQVPGTSITYIGSPYQVTASEAGQQKRLLLLDTNWQQLDSIPISVGRKYFSLATPAAATNAAVSTGPAAAGRPAPAAAGAGAEDGTSSSSNEGSESDQDPFLGLPATEAAAGSGVLQLDVGHIQQLLAEGALQAGDLVHLRAEQDDGSEADVSRVVKVLTDRGVQVQVHRAPSMRVSARIDAAEQLSMSQLLEVYADNVGMGEDVRQAAREALKVLGSQSSAVPKHSHLELEEVTVEGFGPFAQAVSYPLTGRGVVAVTGLNRDDAAAVSNGAGKTSLLTSLLWAFKAPDGRRMTNADYINDTSKKARVTVTGRINGESFELTRSATKSKSSLQLVVAGRDLTQQEQRLTEAQLEARFSASLLPRTLVFTQEDLLELLQYGDAAFKRMLSSVVDTDCWEAAREAAAEQRKGLAKQQDRAEGVMQSLTAAVQRLQLDLQQTAQQEQGWEEQVQTQKASAAAKQQTWLQQAQQAAQQTQEQLQHCAETLREVSHLQQGLQAAVADARQKAEAAAAQLQGAADPEPDPLSQGAQQQMVQTQQQLDATGPPPWDAAAAAKELQPLVLAEQAAMAEVQKQQGGVQQLKGQLAAAAARRKKYEQLQGPAAEGSSSTAAAAGAQSVAQLLAGGNDGSGSGARAHVCEQCLQPINVDLYKQNLENMAQDEGKLQQQLQAAMAQQQTLSDALTHAAQARQQLQLEQQRQQQEAAAARDAAMRQLAAESRRQAEAAEQRRRTQQQQQQRQQALLSSIWQEERELTQFANQLQSLHSSLSKVHADSTATLQHLATRLDLPLPQQQQHAAGLDAPPTNPAAVDAVLSSLQSRQAGLGAASPTALDSFVKQSTELQSRVQQSVQQLHSAAENVAGARTQLSQLQAMSNPYSAAVQQLQRQLTAQQQDLELRQQQQAELEGKVSLWARVESAFGRTGIPSFLLEGVLGELQAASSRHLAHLAAGMTLELSATSSRRVAAAGSRSNRGTAAASSSSSTAAATTSDEDVGADTALSSVGSRAVAGVAAAATATGASVSSGDSLDDEAGASGSSTSGRGKQGGGRRAAGAAAGAVKEEISKVVRVQGAAGALMERSIAQLSGGEKKRVALALGLGFAEVVAARGRLTSNILVLDEVLEKLDDEGCTRVAWLLKGLPYDSVFVVGQAGSFVTKEFAAVDTVVKAGGRSFVELGSGSSSAHVA